VPRRAGRRQRANRAAASAVTGLKHAGHWYVTGTDPAVGEVRTFRLDRIRDVRGMPGSFAPPEPVEPVERFLRGLATAPRRHAVRVLIRAGAEEIAAVLPPGLATLEEVPDPSDGPWFRAELQVEDLRWLPPLLASLDRPFRIEQPEELRVLTAALAERLAASVRRSDPAGPRA
jgi:predicted DNA-binding transcriptional regulator YafY